MNHDEKTTSPPQIKRPIQAPQGAQVKIVLPSVSEVAREAIIVIGGAVLAAVIVGQFPALRAWLKAQWQDGAAP